MSSSEEEFVEWFDDLYKRYMYKMTVIATRRLNDQRKAEELVHDTFELLWKHRKDSKIMNHPNIAGWLIKTLGFLILNEVHSCEYKNEYPLDASIENLGIPCQPFEKLEDVLPNDLTENEKNLLIWYYEDRLDYEEIARILGVSQSVCRMRMTRTRRHCMKLMKNE